MIFLLFVGRSQQCWKKNRSQGSLSYVTYFFKHLQPLGCSISSKLDYYSLWEAFFLYIFTVSDTHPPSMYTLCEYSTCRYQSWITRLLLTAHFYPLDISVFEGSHSISGVHHSTLRRAFRVVMFQRIALFSSPPKLPPLLRSSSPFLHLIVWSEGASSNFERLHFRWIIHYISSPGANLTSIPSLKWFCEGVFESCTPCEITLVQFFFLTHIATSKDLQLQASNEKQRGSKKSFVSTFVKFVE